MLNAMIPHLRTGEVRAFAFSPSGCMFDDSSPQPFDSDYRVINLTCSSLPTLEECIDLLLNECARIALALWPHWFGLESTIPRQSKSMLERLFERDSLLQHFTHSQNDISKNWLKDSTESCYQQKIPVFDGYPKAIQAAYLSKAIHLKRLHVFIHVKGRQAQEGRLYGLVRASEWFAANAPAAVGLVVDPELIRHPELSSALLEPQEFVESHPLATIKVIGEEDRSVVWPVVGRPHPFSPGEQLLAKRLHQDDEMASLFAFNQRIETTRGNHYLVDLLWENGRLIVEVDGYRYHSNRTAFFNDRQRDYELLISGYRMLRLDHDEVVNDVDLCVEKIRDVVRLCQNNPYSERNPS